MNTYQEKKGVNPISLGTWVQEMPKHPCPQGQRRVGLGMQGGGRPYRIFFRVVRLGSPQPALDLGERLGWHAPHTSPGEAGGSPNCPALTEKAHAIPTRQAKTRAVLMAAFSRNSETRRGLAFQLGSTTTTPNHTGVCVHRGERGEERLISSHFSMGSCTAFPERDYSLPLPHRLPAIRENQRLSGMRREQPAGALPTAAALPQPCSPLGLCPGSNAPGDYTTGSLTSLRKNK